MTETKRQVVGMLAVFLSGIIFGFAISGSISQAKNSLDYVSIAADKAMKEGERVRQQILYVVEEAIKSAEEPELLEAIESHYIFPSRLRNVQSEIRMLRQQLSEMEQKKK